MTVRSFLIGSLVAGLTGGGVWLLVLWQLDPAQAGNLGKVLFFLSLFVGLFSVTSLLGYAFRRLIWRAQFPSVAVRTSLRQGILISLYATVLLFLQLIRIYRWWLALLLVAVFGFIELIFLSYDRAHTRPSVETREES